MAPEEGSAPGPAALIGQWLPGPRMHLSRVQNKRALRETAATRATPRACRSSALAPRTRPPSSGASPHGPWLAASAVSLLPHVGQASPQRLWRFHLELFGLRLVRSCHLRTLTVVWLCRASRPSARGPAPRVVTAPFPLSPASLNSAQSVTLVYNHWFYASLKSRPSRTSITTVRDPKRS